jgi:hypothetical protein
VGVFFIYYYNKAKFLRLPNIIGIIFWDLGGEILEANDSFLKYIVLNKYAYHYQ